MKHLSHARLLRRSTLAVVLGLGLAQATAFAQSTSGEIVGSAPTAAGQKITIKSLASGVSRDVVVGSDGRFRASALPLGQYEVSIGGDQARTVTVVAGQATNTSFTESDATALSTVQVRGGGFNAIDVTSVESRTTFTADQLNSLPVGRDITSVSLLTPGTVASSGYFGPASFGGASAAENSYYVNGFNVTNLYDSLSFSEVPFQAIDQLDVQTGGYGAEYGFSTGGVTSVNVKRGTNEWKGGFSWSGSPNWGRENKDNNYRSDGSLYSSSKNDYTSSNTYSTWVGGPLIEDKLFVFALGQFSQSNQTRYGTRSSSGTSTTPSTSLSTTANDYESTTPYWLVKLDWYPNENNHIEYTGFDNSRRYTYDYYNAAYSAGDSTGTPSKTSYLGQLVGKTGGQTDIFKWTSNLSDTLTASLQYGQMRNRASQYTISADGVASSYDGDINGAAGACPYVYNYVVGSRTGCAVTSSVDIDGGWNERKSWRTDFDWQLGNHRIGFGYNNEDWKSKSGTSYSAGQYWLVYPNYALLYNFRTGGTVQVKQESWYLQDKWQVSDNVLLYLGVRNDSFDNYNTTGQSFVKQDNIWQPRVGVSWDVTGDGRNKLFASAGRYSLPISANVALRAASASYYTYSYYTYSGTDATTGVPNVTGSYAGGAYDGVSNGQNGSVPDAAAVASKGLKPYSQDEVVLGFQHRLASSIDFLDGWNLGAKAIYRRLNNAIDDTCDSRGIYNAATEAGYDLSNWDDEWTVPSNLPGCWIFNPGSDLTVTLDVDGDGTAETITVPGSQLSSDAKRTYKALSLSADKSTDRWYISANYTWAKLQGNAEGLVKSTNGQDDTGTTSDFDFLELTYGANGYLFNDHRHTFKLYGGYAFNDEWRVGANLQVQSGAPISCLGGGYGSFGTEFGYSGVFHTCNVGEDDISKVGSSGRTPWTATFSPNVVYTPKWLEGLSLQATVMNLFNSIKPLQVYETVYGQNSAGTVTNYYNYKVGKYYTSPRTVRLQVQYDW